jgi:hypothetical protein
MEIGKVSSYFLITGITYFADKKLIKIIKTYIMISKTKKSGFPIVVFISIGFKKAPSKILIQIAKFISNTDITKLLFL